MLSHLRLASASRLCLRSLSRPVPSYSQSRGFISSSAWWSSLGPEPPTDPVQSEYEVDAEDSMMSEGEQGSSDSPASYRAFLESIGAQFQVAKPNNWLGGQLPFPMNPSFKPPPPISDKQRELMWDMYNVNGTTGSIRMLSKKFNISINRVEAILRLKHLEKTWEEGKQLQTGFQVGMERLLNATTHSSVKSLKRLQGLPSTENLPVDKQRSDVHEADILEQEEKRDSQPLKYERLYWESMPEGRPEPTMPNILQHSKKLAECKMLASKAQSNARFMKRIPDTPFMKRPKDKIVTLLRDSRPATQFIDVGARFLEVGDQAKRVAASQRKAKIRDRKSHTRRGFSIKA